MNERILEWIAPGMAIGGIFLGMATWVLNLRDTVREQASEISELKTILISSLDNRIVKIEALKLDSLNDRVVKLETYHEHWVDHLVNKMAAAQNTRDERLGITSAAKVYSDVPMPADAIQADEEDGETAAPK